VTPGRNRPLCRAGGEDGALAAALILRLLVTWCDQCPPAVTALLAAPAHLPLLLDIASARCAVPKP
jgi:hypothetical protein